MYLGSDAIALAPFTDAITYLEEGDWAVLRRSGAEILIATRPGRAPDHQSRRQFPAGGQGQLPPLHGQGNSRAAEVISHTLANYLDMVSARVNFPDLGIDLAKISRVTISACGTAYYAGLVAKYWIERFARVAVDIDVASEMRYRETPLPEGGLAVFVSQSGETADTLATLRYCKANGQRIASIVNVRTSTIARESHAALPTLAGPEIGVASTKAFTCQLSVLACLAIAIARARGQMTAEQKLSFVKALTEIPRHVASILRRDEPFIAVAQELAKAADVLYLGRGSSFPIALEGALKLKEISYIHAEGYAAGELKHGPIALIDEHVPVIVVAPEDDLFEKTVSNLQEVAARGGQIILISDATPEKVGCKVAAHIQMPKASPFVAPLLYAVPTQLIAYHTAVLMGTDVDQPRNLAKSVTVE